MLDDSVAAVAFDTPALRAPAPRLLRAAAPAPDHSQPEAWFGLVLDELDYGVVLLRDGAHVLHVNHAARTEVRDGRSVEIVSGELRARQPAQQAAFADALAATAQRGLRKLVNLGASDERIAVALVPLGGGGPDVPFMTLVMLGRRRLSERLSVEWFARTHGLTPAESRVLELLCHGLEPRAIAAANDVGLSTVRTQVINIRAKTGATGIRGLVQQVAMLPPLVSSLRR